MQRQRFLFRVAIAIALLATLAFPVLAIAATIWNGPSITFTRPDNVNGALTQYQDCITASVCLARLNIRGLFNGAAESGYSYPNTPSGTSWAFQGLNGNPSSASAITASNYANLTFTNFTDALEYEVGDLVVDRPGVLHITAGSSNIYLNITFTHWTVGSSDEESGAGGFAYVRSTAGTPTQVPALSPFGLVLLACLLVGFVAWMARRSHRLQS